MTERTRGEASDSRWLAGRVRPRQKRVSGPHVTRWAERRVRAIGSTRVSRAWRTKAGAIMSRNSFFNVLKPDITIVEILKDVTTKRELIVRLVAHDIVYQDEDEEIGEIVLKEETYLPVKRVQSKTQVLVAKMSTAASKKKCCSCCRSTKTIDSHMKSTSVATTSLSKTGSFAEYSTCAFEDVKYSNGARSLNTNVNSATSALSYWLDNQTQCFARDSFLIRSGLQNCEESAVASSKQCRSICTVSKATF
ncbi:hypothetical protein NDU88_006031 [Pleurodeles waltl]|uniref:Fibrous sheath-interacting protein 2 C-terminal domain-containing protein n=1 Tax=Pleurodeles waltl TaxID=8319 RepID=A0AAV7VNF4_PLEWA|nr:hypothetical protein NDU88_006031 [Pleurodeles waltl]